MTSNSTYFGLQVVYISPPKPLMFRTVEELVDLFNILEQHSAAYGLGINYKTKVMIVDKEHDNHREIKSAGRCEVV
ncbi:unnamed protein product [Callosobruchus maculatus]|uniref:Uncharacterized protein n=1 Tax=Callosobruchus maculatus TaxID=64391 RepID=A0A653DEU1_CALMS|nr:unnamed protein product [Callosobruchus maculatus]